MGGKWILWASPILVLIVIIKFLRLNPTQTADDQLDLTECGQFENYLRTEKAHVVVDSQLEFPEYEEDMLEDGEKFFIFLPYEGATNQMISIMRAINIATKLNRTLLMPAIHSSRHDEVKNLHSDWRHFLNFTEILNDPAICRIKWINRSMIPKLQVLMKEPSAACVTFGRWSELWILGIPAWNFVYGLNLDQSFRLDWRDNGGTCILDYVSPFNESPLICVGNIFHMNCGHDHAKYVKKISFSDNVLKAAWTFLQEVGIKSSKYASIHWRRGDFEHACLNKNMTSCWPEYAVIEYKIKEIHLKTGIKDFVISTNDLDLMVPKSDLYDVFISKLPSFDDGPWTSFLWILMDSCLMAYSDYFLGNQYSSVSRIARQRRIDRGNKNTEFF